LDGTATSDSTSLSLSVAPQTIRIGLSHANTQALNIPLAHVAVFAGTASDTLIARHKAGVHPTQLPGQLLECWDLDRVGPIVGLVRGTVLNPVNGGSLTTGPAHVQGPPVLRRSWVATAAGGTDYTLSADPGTATVTGTAAALKWARKLAASAGTAVATGTAASLEWGREVTGAAGTAVISTVTAILLWFRKLFGAAGTAEVTGTDATLSRDRVLTADAPGTVDITGGSATLTYSGDTGGGVNAKRQRLMMMGVTRLWWLLLFTHRN
jgi:hypothetical protein